MATPMAFILPTASYLRLTRGGRSHWYSRDRLIAWAIMVFGFVVMVIGTALSIEQVRVFFSCMYQSQFLPMCAVHNNNYCKIVLC